MGIRQPESQLLLLQAVSVHSGYNIIPQTGFFINNKHFFLTVLEAGKIKVPADLVSDESPLPGIQPVPSRSVLTWWNGQGSFLGPLL